jgi:hypothetical protein
MSTLPSRAAVERAEPLTFEGRKPAKQDLLITVKAELDHFPIELSFSGSVDQLPAIVKRLRALGASEPVSAAPTTPPASTNGKAKVAPEYNDAGEECCPNHHRKLRGPNQWGKLFCSAKDEAGEYCKYTWKPE